MDSVICLRLDKFPALRLNSARQIKTSAAANDVHAWTGGVNASSAYSTNGLNQYTTVAEAGFTYDANANLASDNSVSYGYDVAPITGWKRMARLACDEMRF